MAGGDRKSADSVLVAALAGGATVSDAAARAHTSERTVYRRLDDSAFREQIADARADMVARVVGRLVDASTAAADTLVELLTPATTASVRLGAAKAILELGGKFRESEELEDRLEAVEQALAEGRLRRVS